MIAKTPIVPDRIRRIPKSFSWIDHQLVRDRHLDELSHTASALYLFLICVGDAKGLSFYGDQTLMERLSMTGTVFEKARMELIHNGLIAWRRPVYQVLDLIPQKAGQEKPQLQRDNLCGSGGMMRISDIFKRLASEAK